MNRSIRLLSFVLFLLTPYLLPLTSAEADNITMTTYYPAPSGDYNNLKVKRMCVGTTCTNLPTNDNDLYVQGNVGIGATAPADKLTLVPIAYSASQDGGIRIQTPAGQWVSRIALKSTSSGTPRFAIDTPTGSGTFAEALTIAYSTGNVGIGTTTPTHNLDIYDSAKRGSLRVTGEGAGYTNAELVLQANNGTDARGLGTFLYQATSQKEWFIGSPYSTSDSIVIARQTGLAAHSPTTAQNSNALVKITSAGNVGIGTTSPQTNLQINGRWFVTDNGPAPTSGEGMFGSYDTTNDAGRLQAYDYTGAAFKNLSLQANGGNVGIGTASPLTTLDVRGDVLFGVGTNNGEKGRIRYGMDYFGSLIDALVFEKTDDDTTAEGGIVFGFAPSTGTDTPLGDPGWAVNHSAAMAIRGNGNVGIGTINPSTKLEVNGQVKITGGTPGVDQVLTSDANGLATWEPLTTTRSQSGTYSILDTNQPPNNTWREYTVTFPVAYPAGVTPAVIISAADLYHNDHCQNDNRLEYFLEVGTRTNTTFIIRWKWIQGCDGNYLLRKVNWLSIG